MAKQPPKPENVRDRPNYGGAAIAFVALAATVVAGSEFWPAQKSQPNTNRLGPVAAKICQETNPTGWIAVPPGLNVELIAATLDVDQDSVRAGSIGTAVCRQAISPLELTKTRIVVEGQGTDCVAVGLATPNGGAPKGELNYKDVLAVCAGPVGPSV